MDRLGNEFQSLTIASLPVLTLHEGGGQSSLGQLRVDHLEDRVSGLTKVGFGTLAASAEVALEREILGLLEVGFNTLRVSEDGNLRLPEAGMHISGVVLDSYSLKNGTIGSLRLDLEAVRDPRERGSGIANLDTIVLSRSTMQIALVPPFLPTHEGLTFANPVQGFRDTLQRPIADRGIVEGAADSSRLGSVFPEIREWVDGACD